MNRNKLKKGNIGNKNFTQKVMFFITSGVILPVAIIVILLGFASNVFAQVSLEVTFDSDPLFDEANFLPGDEASGEVTVTNNSSEEQDILTEAINVSDNNNLGSQLNITIEDTGGPLYNDQLSDFLSTAGEVSLGIIAPGASRIFTYTISFIDFDDNSYQGKTLGFDVCVGFQGGDSHCGDTVIGGENGDGGGGSISGSGSSGSVALTIFDEQALDISNVGASGSATITWNTNKLATSQVIYGLLSDGPYILNVVEPYVNFFGYPLATTEDGTKVVNHSMLLTGLTSGETYLYRVVSRASPPTVSPEHQFTVPLLAQAGGPGLMLGASAGGTGNGEPEPAGSVLGETYPDTEEIPGLDKNLAAVFASGFGDILSICTLIALLILLVIYLIWRLWLRRKYEQSGVAEEEILNRFYLFFTGSLLLVILVLVALGYYCPIPILVVIFVISLGVYVYRKFMVK